MREFFIRKIFGNRIFGAGSSSFSNSYRNIEV